MQRKTRQRDAIQRALEEADRPLGPEEIQARAQKIVPRLGIATVYRTVKALTEAGTLVTVDLPGEPTRYEIAGKDHHHHFHCRACGRVFEVEGCPGDLSRLNPPGFKLEDHEVILYGLCGTCAG